MNSRLGLLPEDVLGVALRTLDHDSLVRAYCASATLRPGVQSVVDEVAARHGLPAGCGPLLLRQLAGVLRSARVALGRENGLIIGQDGACYSFANGGSDDDALSLGREVPHDADRGVHVGYTQTPRPVGYALLNMQVKLVAVGYTSSFAVDAAGQIWSWGENWHGELGHGDTLDRSSPSRLAHLDGAVVRSLSVNEHRAAVLVGGALYAWGAPFVQDGDAEGDILAPRLVTLSGGGSSVEQPFVSVSMGYYFCVAVDTCGSVYWWGQSHHIDQPGLTREFVNRPATISRLAFPHRAAQLSAGDGHCLILAASGAVYAFGSNSFNQTAPLPNTDHDVLQPTLVPGLSGIAAVHASTYSSFAVTRTGELLAWGGALDGELGSGSIEHRRTGPARIEALSGVRIGALGGFSNSFVAATSDETGAELYYTWGQTCAYVSGHQQSSPLYEPLLEPTLFALGASLLL